MTIPGYVYVLINESFPDLIKIGRTRRDSRARARELSTTGVPTPFRVAFEIFSDDTKALEEKIHAELSDFRVAANREFFRYPLARAIVLLQQRNPLPEDGSYVAQDILPRLVGLYRSWLRPGIAAIRLVQPGDRVWLEITTESFVAGYLKDQTIVRTDLGFISGREDRFFDPGADVSENARRFVEEFDAYSIAMTTDIFTDEACREICDRGQR